MALRSSGGLLLVCLVLLSGFLAILGLPQPVRFFWNYPDEACRQRKIDFHLGAFGFEYNQHGFLGEKISTLYSSKFGKWPHPYSPDMGVNGGLPQYGNLSAHLEKLSSSLRSLGYGQGEGLAVLDMEVWRPVLRTNWGRFKPYVSWQIDEIKKSHPYVSHNQLVRIATEIWENATREFMEATILEAKQIWPNKLWGYYGYPELVSRNYNHKLAWLWKVTDAFFPSIYIKSFAQGKDQIRRVIEDKLSEAFRIRALYGRPDIPIFAYTLVQTTALGKFSSEWLDLAIRLPSELGIDGLVLWASSKEFSHPVATACHKQQTYVLKILGPKVKAVLADTTRCSYFRCGGGHGRCVRKAYAQKNPYVVVRYPRPPQPTNSSSLLNDDIIIDDLYYNGDASSNTNNNINNNNKGNSYTAKPTSIYDHYDDDFVCQCYKGWTGDRCQVKYEV